MENSIEDVAKVLRSRGLRVTPQRVAILRLLKRGQHYTLEQIFNAVKGSEPGISISTVYYTLNTFIKVGLVRSFEVSGKTWYEAWSEPHINVYCRDTGEIMDLQADLTPIISSIRAKGLNVEDLVVLAISNCGRRMGEDKGSPGHHPHST